MHGRIDSNQAEIVDALRGVGASVISLTDVWGGVPDLMVGFSQKNFLLEVKTARGVLTKAQRSWHSEWRGHCAVVRTVAEALSAIGVEVEP